MFQLRWILLLAVVGCGPFTDTQQQPAPTPTPIEVDAAVSMKFYADKLAEAFDHSADQFEQHQPSLTIINEMGVTQKAARLAAFMPLMERLNELAPKATATDAERDAADMIRARVLREWAAQLRGVK